MNRIQAIYQVSCDAGEVERLSRDIALEQTVEVPESLLTNHPLRKEVIGRVESIEPLPGAADRFRVQIAYPEWLSSYQIGQLFNLIYGNISMKRHIRLLDLQFSDGFLEHFPGPNFGIDGIRNWIGMHGRPLLATALKPRGAAPEELAGLARQFALGGGDLIKDDHNLVDRTFDEFKERVGRCFRAVEEAVQVTGRSCLYFPHASGAMPALEKQIEWAIQQGIRGVLISPMLAGLETVQNLAARYPIAFMAHPTFTGAFFHDPNHGMDPGLLLGKLFRLIGCDISIFPNSGGRFTFSPEDCRRIGEQLREPMGTLRTAFPAPAGGMRYENLPAMGREFGQDSVLLIGGALLSHSQSLQESTATFLQLICEQFPEKRTTPQTATLSACEIPSQSPAGALLEHLRFQPDYSWLGREPTAYKADPDLPFRDVRRVELTGRSGEKTAFDLRYFEIEPGGYTSLEKHVHTHVVIGVRGTGTVISGEKQLELNPFDVVYVPPLRVHQLRNQSNEPFGFFCIVDRDRDHPQPPS